MKPYNLGYDDAINGRQNRWVYMNNPSYLKGYMAGLDALYPRKKPWWWPF